MESNTALKRLAKSVPHGSDRSPATVKRRPAPPEPISVEARALWTKVSAIDWLQTVDLGHGVVTPGRSDERDRVSQYGLPHSLVGRRVLDFASFDGFWAFELERRGADVVALDLVDDDVRESLAALRGPAAQYPDGCRSGFALAKETLQSRVELVEQSAYGLEADRLGRFDLVLMNDAVRHLRCPQRAIERAVSLCDEIVLADVVSPALEGMGDEAISEYKADGAGWWTPNAKTLTNMMIVAGCEPVDLIARFDIDNGPGGLPLQKVVLRGRVNTNPVWLQEWCRTAAMTPPKWRSAEEREQ
jgi:tRNA (mo5U34)-methyltransferase